MGTGRDGRPGRWIGIGITGGVVAAIALAGFGVWGGNASAGDTARTDAHTAAAISTRTVPARPVTTPSVTTTRPVTPPTVTTTHGPRTGALHQLTAPTTTVVKPKVRCAQCTTEFSVRLSRDAHLDGVLWTDGPTRIGWLDYYAHDRLVARSGLSEATPQPGDWDTPRTGKCRAVAGIQRCAVAYDTGAHSSGVVLFTVGTGGIHITDRVVGAAAGAWLNDLDGDGLPDATVVDVRFTTDYADSPTVWHTFVQRGGKLVDTGCSAPLPTLTGAIAPPTKAETGRCPAS